ncbi:type VI secretion system baseplate subunit TssE [Aliikangiella maris]|uniref:Type VI secretion system baseplate subunit TssE n=2 Tax=Aliikangiella maris TaxID=3162458 RepID=A0ABV2BSN0_9GAMM
MESTDLLSIIDKLIDHEPDKKAERKKSQYEVFLQIKSGIRRDLENLLNAKVDWNILPENCFHLEKSLVNYGLPDFTSINLAAKEYREQFIRIIESAIGRFETRFARVEVILSEDPDDVDRNLHFTIRAVLKGDMSSEVISFNTRVEPINRKVYLEDYS